MWKLPKCRFVLPVIAFVSIFGVCAFGLPQLSGSTTVNLSAIPLPCSLVGEVKLDTPCERTVFSWDLDMAIKLKLSFSPSELWLDAVGGFAGFEHVIVGAKGTLAGATIQPELWFAVPFESVTDINNLSNAAVIAPGELLFAAARVEASGEVGDFSVRWISVLQDLNFPSPGADFPYLHYGVQSQSFAMGSYVTMSGPVVDPVRLSLQIGMGAEPGGYQVKGYSKSGKAVPDRLYARLAISPIPVACPYCDSAGLPISDVKLGLTFQIEPKDDPFLSLQGSINLKALDTVRVGTSFTMEIPEGIKWGGISVSAPTELGTLNLHFDPQGEFKSGTLNMGYRTELNLGWTSGTFMARATATSEHGISSASASLSLGQGTFSSSYNLAYTWQSGKGLSFASFALRFRINLNPLQVGVHITFGRFGLGRFTVSTGYVF